MELKTLEIGNLKAKFPIVLGGMGIGVSLSKLAAAVTREGGIGVISAAQPAYREDDFYTNTIESNKRELIKNIKDAKKNSNNGIIGVNIMVASMNYGEYVKAIIDGGADIIISGAGLPIELPKYTSGSSIKIAPIVSSYRALKIILERWDKRNNVTADMIVIEGPKAGGHLGFKAEALEHIENIDMETEIKLILEYKKTFEEKYSKKIPVIFGGGVFTRNDINYYIELGLDGVQMATRFVATEECDADINFKNAYINAKKEDIEIVKSPVGMPGRAIRNSFIEKAKKERIPVKKCFNCLYKRNPADTPYCISMALMNASIGDLENGLVFCGSNAYKIDKISTVHEIFTELTQ